MNSLLEPPPPSEEARGPILNTPPVVKAVIAVLAAVHVATLFPGQEDYDAIIANFSLIPAKLLESGGYWYTLVSYAFLHAGFDHLIVNVLWFLVFATAVARRVGAARLLVLMLVTALGAAFTHLFFHWGSGEPVVGASGAVSGLMGAAFRFIFIDGTRPMEWPPARLPLTSRPVLLATALWVALNVLFGVTGLTPDGFGRSIAWEAHLGGYFTGLLLFAPFDRRRSWIR